MSDSERPHNTRLSSRGKTAVAAVQPSRRHTARRTLSVLRSGTAPGSRMVFSADFTLSPLLFFWLDDAGAARLDEPTWAETNALRIFSALHGHDRAPRGLCDAFPGVMSDTPVSACAPEWRVQPVAE